MGLFDRFRSRPETPPNTLLGCWHLVREPGDGAEDTDMEFRPNGELTYAMDAGDRWQIMRLTYRIEGGTIISDQPSAPQEERTRFHMESDGTLVLDQEGARTRFRRGFRRAPEV